MQWILSITTSERKRGGFCQFGTNVRYHWPRTSPGHPIRRQGRKAPQGGRSGGAFGFPGVSPALGLSPVLYGGKGEAG
jgi:hypothetical protein